MSATESLYPRHASAPVEQLTVSPTEAEQWQAVDAWLQRQAGSWSRVDCWPCELGRICDKHKPEAREHG